MYNNLYFDEFFRFDSVSQQLNTLEQISMISNSDQTISPQTVCAPITDVHCTGYLKDEKLCTGCEIGYFLDDQKVCQINPVDPINKCEVYKSATGCSKCEENYHLDNITCKKRKADEDIPFCKTYNSSAASVICYQCLDTHFLISNKCAMRFNSYVGSITNCLSVNLTSDKCETCEDDYILTSHKIACKEKINYCRLYAGTIYDENLTCDTCIDGYYLTYDEKNIKSRYCLYGNIANCAVYEENSPVTCLLCSNSYYLFEGLCNKSPFILSCLKYDPVIARKCEVCSPLTFKLLYIQNCQKIVNKVKNCAKHSGNSVLSPICDECVDGFYLLENKCLAIPFLG